jgi:serine/threonine protein kinase
MLTGLPPFYDENTNEMYRKILSEPLHFPGPEIVPPAARDLLTRLLDRNPELRLGAKGAAEIKATSSIALIGESYSIVNTSQASSPMWYVLSLIGI